MTNKRFIISAVIMIVTLAIMPAAGQLKNVQFRKPAPAAEAVYEDGRKTIFLDNHHVKIIYEVEGEMQNITSMESDWWLDNGVLVYFTGEGTAHCSIIDGYEYEGRYDSSDGMCYNEEWVGDEQDGGLEDVGYYPVPARGTRLKSFTWLKSMDGQSGRQEESRSTMVQSHKLSVTANKGLTDPLPSHNTSTYGADRLTDNNPKTGWAIKFTPAENVDSPIWGPSFELDEDGVIDYIVIRNGYGKSPQLYNRNYRPAWITIYRPIPPDTGDPESSEILYDGPIEDTMEPQRLPVNKDFDFSTPVKHLCLKLPRYTPQNYYKGSTYDHLVISEIEFWGH